MFWPSYFLEPNYVGTTLHYIKMIDRGNIVQHNIPRLQRGDYMHEVVCKTRVVAAEDVMQTIGRMGKGEVFPGKSQKNQNLFLEKE